jgi:ABC-type uncharacterized transport system permease subunit
MRKYTNRILTGLYLAGLLAILFMVIVIRWRLDQVIEITV